MVYNFLRKLSFAFIVVSIASACSEDEIVPDPQEPQSESLENVVVVLGNKTGDTKEEKLLISENWSVQNNEDWFSVEPLSGFAGENKLVVKALKSNEKGMERVAFFNIVERSRSSKIYVVQEGVPTLNLSTEKVAVSSNSQEFGISLSANIEFDVVSKADWITVGDIQSEEGEMLAEGKAKSSLVSSVIKIAVKDNSAEGAQDRSGMVVIVANGQEYTVEINQMGGNMSVDFSKVFRRRSLMLRFTATWCGYCPMMGQAVEDAVEMYPGHIIPMFVHASNSRGGMAYEKAEEFERMYKVSGYPTGVFNSMVTFGNQSSIADTKEAIVNLAKEAVADLPSNTAIAGIATAREGRIFVDLEMAAKEAGEYNLCAFVLEDGIVFKQENGGKDYVHDYVIRKDMCGTAGTAVELQAKKVVKKTISISMPISVKDLNNCHVLVYLAKNVSASETFVGHVENMTYGNFGAYVDNVCDIPLGGFARFLYEE